MWHLAPGPAAGAKPGGDIDGSSDDTREGGARFVFAECHHLVPSRRPRNVSGDWLLAPGSPGRTPSPAPGAKRHVSWALEPLRQADDLRRSPEPIAQSHGAPVVVIDVGLDLQEALSGARDYGFPKSMVACRIAG